MKIHPIDTVNVPGFQGETLNLIFGCDGHSCKTHCWLFNQIIPQFRRMEIPCKLCCLGSPHTHFERAAKIPQKGQPRCYFQSCAEPNDASPADVRRLQEIIAANPRHIFQILTHFPEFWQKFPVWPKNTWAMTTYTEGAIFTPASVRAGKTIAYCEPVMGEIWIGEYLDWLVIGLLNHQPYTVDLVDWIGNSIWDLMDKAERFQIPVFCKNPKDPRWKTMGITPIQQWPEV